MTFVIRQETEADYPQTKEVVRRAFLKAEHTDHDEHELIGRLRRSPDFIPELSLIAATGESGEIIGHILLSKISIQNRDTDQQQVALALAPLSVVPEWQNSGVGVALTEQALAKAKALGYPGVIVLGHPGYYPRFGFQAASRWGIHSPFPVADEVFMALELRPGALEGVSGTVQYNPAFFE